MDDDAQDEEETTPITGIGNVSLYLNEKAHFYHCYIVFVSAPPWCNLLSGGTDQR